MTYTRVGVEVIGDFIQELMVGEDQVAASVSEGVEVVETAGGTVCCIAMLRLNV